MVTLGGNSLATAADSIDCVFRLESQIFLVETHGRRGASDALIAAIRRIADASRASAGRMILWTDFSFGKRTELTDAYQLGLLMAELFSFAPLAIVPSGYMPREECLMSHLIHIFATNRGYPGRVCRDEEDARAWLATWSSGCTSLAERERADLRAQF